MKKIVILSLTLGVGGIEKYVATLSNLFCSEFEVEIICTYKTMDKPAFSIPNNVNIKYLIDAKPDEISLKKLIKDCKFIAAAKEIVKRFKLKYLEKKLNIDAIKEIDCDYLITTRTSHNALVNKYLDNKKVITIATEHNYHQDNKKYINNLVKSVSNFDYFVVATNELFDFYKPKLKKAKCVKISNIIDNISKEKIDFSNKNFISVGRFSPEKGFLDLIDVFSLIHKENDTCKLYLLGDGFQKELINKKVKECGLEDYIIMPGFVLTEDQKDYYFNSSVYLMSSYTECFGLVLIEAMNYGLPCIAFDSASGARELLSDDIGILVKERNKEEMARVALELLNDNKKLNDYQKRIGKYIKKFDKDDIRQEWYKIIKK